MFVGRTGDHRDLHSVDRRQRQMCIRDRHVGGCLAIAGLVLDVQDACHASLPAPSSGAPPECTADPANGKLQFSGANRPLIRMRQGVLSEFKPDKMTIGVAPLREQPFTNQVLDIMPGDTFYLYSDGFSDQFGEISDKKFKQKQLKKLIESMSGLSMSRQKSFLKETFYQWKGNCQQIDDVLIFGFQI